MKEPVTHWITERRKDMVHALCGHWHKLAATNTSDLNIIDNVTCEKCRLIHSVQRGSNARPPMSNDENDYGRRQIEQRDLVELKRIMPRLPIVYEEELTVPALSTTIRPYEPMNYELLSNL